MTWRGRCFRRNNHRPCVGARRKPTLAGALALGLGSTEPPLSVTIAAPMKTFHCTHCQNLIFFENVRCLNCGHSLAFLPDLGFMGALSERPDGLWRAELDAPESRGYRLCANYDQVSVCNWVVPADDSGAFCGSCRLNRVIPDLSSERNRVAWFRLEVAKRRLLYTLLGLWLPIEPKAAGADSGLAFEFLEDSSVGDVKRILTGHDNG